MKIFRFINYYVINGVLALCNKVTIIIVAYSFYATLITYNSSLIPLGTDSKNTNSSNLKISTIHIHFNVA